MKIGRRLPRRKGVLATVGLVVEGDTEFVALPLLYRMGLVPNCPPLRPKNLGGVGSHLLPVGVARMALPKVIAHRAAGVGPVVVCIDREQRNVCPGAFAVATMAALAAELTMRSISPLGVSVVVSDRTFEAWILADARGLHARGHFANAPTFHAFEGELGAQQKKGVVELAHLLGRPYAKTQDGPRLFSKLDFASARAHAFGGSGSRSLDKFLRVLGV